MHFSTLLVPVLAVLAQAAPKDHYARAVTTSAATTTTTSTAAASTTDVNSACAVQPSGIANYKVTPDTDTDFQNSAYLGTVARVAAIVPVSKYKLAFSNYGAAVQQDKAFMTFYYLSSYNTQTCADYCTNTYGCASFNIFFERDPSLNPAAACPNPSGLTNVKCSLFGQTIASTGIATNAGQYRGPAGKDSFHVVVAGSNAYNKQ